MSGLGTGTVNILVCSFSSITKRSLFVLSSIFDEGQFAAQSFLVKLKEPSEFLQVKQDKVRVISYVARDGIWVGLHVDAKQTDWSLIGDLRPQTQQDWEFYISLYFGIVLQK